jgi:hypothetical protein
MYLDKIKKFGFILLRHINSFDTNKYWNQSVLLLNAYYPNIEIVIIDDNSNPIYLHSLHNHKNIKAIINSEYPARGELLPYIYYLRNKWFDYAIILHDSVFIHKTFNFEYVLNTNNITARSLWIFDQDNYIEKIPILAQNLNYTEEIIQIYNNWYNLDWKGCFGAMSIIKHEFLVLIAEKYNMFNLINVIKTRKYRCSFERIIAIIFYLEKCDNKSLFGNYLQLLEINETNCDNINNYLYCFNNAKVLPQNIIKLFTGR